MRGIVCEERLAYGPWAAIERMVARLVLHAGFKDVYLVGGAGDRGADVVGTYRGERWVFQAKYRNSGGVGADAAKEAVRAMNAYNADKAVAIASSYFYPEAYNYQLEAKRNGIPLLLWNGDTLLTNFEKLPSRSSNRRELRDYQETAVDRVESARSHGAESALVVMATGLGKSIVASTLISSELDRNPSQEVLVLAHMNDLVKQLEQSLWPQLAKEHSTHLWTDGERPSYQGGVVYATWQSVQSASRHEDLAGKYGLVIVDEAHHAPSTQFRTLLDQLEPNFLVGLTATPWRGDNRNLEDLFGEAVFTMDIIEGMQQGYLAQVEYHMLTDGIDWDEVSRISRQGLTVKDLNQHLLMPDRDQSMVDLIASRMEETENPRALAFCRSIDHARRLQPVFAQRGIKAALLHSQLSREERFRNLSSFRAGNVDLLISIEMLNEGIDVPDVNVVAFMRVTHSRRIFLQQLGRGLRISPGKDKVSVLDFVADIRRIAAGVSMNREARENAERKSEVVRYQDGIVQFDDVSGESFFDEYLADIASVEDLGDDAQLRFPRNENF